MRPAALGQTIQVVDKSGKVVSTSKHLISVFKEAKYAYQERKAEIVASRHASVGEEHFRRSSSSRAIEDTPSSSTSRPHERTKSQGQRPDAYRRASESSVRRYRSTIYPSSNSEFEQDISTFSRKPVRQDLVRRHTSIEDDVILETPPPTPPRSMSSPSSIDMDLAYGDIPPPLPVARKGDEEKFKGLVNKVKTLLEEADCLQYSVSAIVASLQKNPDAMAAVALTLAEISNMASKMAPGIFMTVKSSAPAVFALLASPQFLVAAGVGVGVTIVAFGGYKIIKRIQAKNAVGEGGMDEMLEFGGDVNGIEKWRRGISGAEGESMCTSVDGELITPRAAALSTLRLQEDVTKLPSLAGENTKAAKGLKGSRGSKRGSLKGPKSSKSAKSEKEKRVKKPSPLRMMFQ